MVKTFDCNNCGGNHPRPINRNCKVGKEEANATMDTNAQILHELKNLNVRMTTMEQKVHSLDEQSSPARSSRSTASKDPADEQDEELILPMISSLRSSRRIQDEVDDRIKELQMLSHKGKCKSQRGGSETVFVKKEIPWPQNYILGGSSKNRVSYDNLSISQWVSGFASIIRDEKDPNVKQCMLDYLTEIMDDSHDFGWKTAKGAHAVLLCRMEEGRVTWQDTDKIDRIRRAYAQKVYQGASGSNSRKTHGKDVPTPCRYFQKGSCSQKGDHDNNGHTYLHVCSRCFENGKKFPHSLKDCRNGPKNE